MTLLPTLSALAQFLSSVVLVIFLSFLAAWLVHFLVSQLHLTRRRAQRQLAAQFWDLYPQPTYLGKIDGMYTYSLVSLTHPLTLRIRRYGDEIEWSLKPRGARDGEWSGPVWPGWDWHPIPAHIMDQFRPQPYSGPIPCPNPDAHQ
jgi:hypothetical protein